MELTFISDPILRQRIEDSIEYIYALYEESKQSDKNKLFQTETYRVIILYTVSVIEAVLFYVYEKRGVFITKTEYKEKRYLPSTYLNTKVEGKIAILVEKTSEKDEPEISLNELAQFLVEEKVLKAETAEKLIRITKMRNSVHLRKKTTHAYTIGQVDDALEFLLYTLTNAHKSLKNRVVS